jgi:hypothetical protein
MARPNLRWLLAVAMCGSVAISVACSGGDPPPDDPKCNVRTGKCPSDPSRDQTEQAQCTQSLKEPKCGTQFKGWEDCTQTRANCGADGKTEKLGPTAACVKEYCAYSLCISGVAPPFCTGAGGTDAGKG